MARPRRGIARWAASRLCVGRSAALVVALVASMSAGCATVPSGEYWDGYYLHVFAPRYSFRVPDGWRPATPTDYPDFGFNRRIAQALDDAGRRAFMETGEQSMKLRDTVLISSRGGWIHAMSEPSHGRAYVSGERLADKERHAIWQRLSNGLIAAAPAADKPRLSLEFLDVADYGGNVVLQIRFTSDVARGSMRWTVLVFYAPSYRVTVAHVGIPEDPDEGVAGLDVIARSFRFA